MLKPKGYAVSTSNGDSVNDGEGASVERWENEGGSVGSNVGKPEYGRRVETDRSWTVYHVYTGVPGQVDSETLIGLSRGKATEIMLALNNVATCRSQR